MSSNQLLEDVINVLLDYDLNLDYFDAKSLSKTNKNINNIILNKYNIRNVVDEYIYILLYDFFVYKLVNKYSNPKELMGVKITLNGIKNYNYTRSESGNINFNDFVNIQQLITNTDVLFTMGITCKNEETIYIYFGTTNNFHCCSIQDVYMNKTIIKCMIKEIISNVREVDIYHYNSCTSVLNTFIFQVMNTFNKYMSIQNFHIQNENVIENILLCHEK